MVDAYRMYALGICRDGTALLSQHTLLSPTASRRWFGNQRLSLFKRSKKWQPQSLAESASGFLYNAMPRAESRFCQRRTKPDSASLSNWATLCLEHTIFS